MLLIIITAITASCLTGIGDVSADEGADLRQEFKVLVSNSVRSIAADADNVWIATDSGVSRFSMSDNLWVSYAKEDGLVSDNVYVVASDGEEAWFGTDNGVSRYKLAEDEWITYREKDGLISNRVNCITQDGSYVWIGTDRGLARFDRNIGSWAARTQEDGLTTALVMAIAVEKDNVWVGTEAKRKQYMGDWEWREERRRSGLNRYDKNADSWNTYTPEEGLMSGQVSTIAADEDIVWIGTSDGGISCYSKKDQAFVRSYSKSEILDTNNIKCIFVDSIYTWIGTANSGIYRYIKTTDTWMQYTVRDGLASNHITSIAVSGNEVWFGTNENGLSKYNKLTQKWTTYVKATYPADNDVRWILADGHEVWAATTRGLSRYDTEAGQWTTYGVKDGLIDGYITHMEFYGDNIFVPMWNGLGRLDKRTGKWDFYMDFIDSPSFVTALEVTGTKGAAPLLLIGTAGAGVFKLSLNQAFEKSLSKSRAAECRRGGNAWADAPADESYPERLLTSDQLPDPYVTCIEVVDERSSDARAVKSGEVWIGTHSGIFLFDMDSQSGRLHANGLASNHARGRGSLVNTIIEDGDNLWIGTTGGLSRYDRASASWETFTSQDGLPSDNVRTLAVADNGDLWIGTPGGLALLHKLGETEYQAFEKRLERKGNAGASAPAEVRTALFSESRRAFYNNIRSISIGRSRVAESSFGEGLSKGGIQGTSAPRSEEISDTLWLATAAGILEFDPSTGEWREHRAEPEKTPFIESGVTGIEFDGTDVWVSNWNSSPWGCIARFDRISRSWLRYTIRDVLNIQPDEKTPTITVVREIIPESHHVWFATDWGILKYNRELDTWRHYTTADGLVDNNVRHLVLGADTAWASSSGRKINRYDEKSDGWLTMRFRNPGDMEENPIEREDEWRLEDMERREQEDRWSNVRDIVVADGSIWFRMGDGIMFFNEYTKELRRFTAEDGLASDRVRCLEYDGRHIWVGHEPDEHAGLRGGVSRYDTSTGEWKTYSGQTILADDRIERILVSDELAWFLPERWSRSGATGYDIRQDNWFTLKPKADSESEDEHGDYRFEGGIVEVISDRENIWVGTMMSGLLQFHTASDSWRFLSDRENVLNNIVMREGLNVDDDFVWLGTMSGLRLYDKKLETWTDYTKPTSLTGNEVRAIAADERYVWCGTNQGISRYDKTEGGWMRFQAKGGRIEIKIGNDTREWWQEESREGLMDNSITGLSADDQYLWVTTHQGANRYDKIADIWDRYSQRNGLPTRSLASVVTDGSDVWIGTNKGLCRYPRMSDDPNAWITYTSMIEIQPMVFSQEYASSLVSNKVRAIAAEKDCIWVGTERGVSRYDKGQDTWRTFTHKDGLVDDEVSCIAVDADNIWFGTANGVTKFSRKTQDWITFTMESGLASNQVTCIAIDNDSVWFGTFDAGLARYDGKAEVWSQFTEDDGLAHNSVLSMTVDGNFIWVGTRRGLTRYDKRANTWTVYREH